MPLEMTYSSDGTLSIAGVSAQTIATQFGTACYAYDAGAIAAAYKAYETAFASAGLAVRIHYACKANHNLGIMRLLKELGAGVDIVSGGEMTKALRAGFTPADVVYSSVGKTDDELTAAITSGVHQINAESAEEVARIADLAQRLQTPAMVALRVNPDVDAKTHAKVTTGKKENKFGIPGDLARDLYNRWDKHPYLKLVGLSVHIGSQLLDVEPYRAAYVFLADLVTAIRQDGHTVERLDLGGGIGIAYKPEQVEPALADYAQIIRDTVADLGCALAVEPGRSLVGNAGYLLARIVEIKHTEHKDYMVLDAAMNDLMRPAMYDSYHHIIPVHLEPSRPRVAYDIVGPVCETGDTFVKHHEMQEMQRGELVALLSAGAYGSAMSSTYNLRPLLPEVLCENGTPRLVRKRQSIEDLIKDEL